MFYFPKVIRKTLFIAFLFLSNIFVFESVVTGQNTIDIRRIKLHEDIDKLQQKILPYATVNNLNYLPAQIEPLNLYIEDILIQKINNLQDSIEASLQLDHRLKVRYLTGINLMLSNFLEARYRQTIAAEAFVLLYNEFIALVNAERSGERIQEIVDRYPYSTGNILLNPAYSIFFDNIGFKDCRPILFRKFCTIYPDKVLGKLEQFTDLPFADSLLYPAALLDPNRFYDYAAATQSSLGKLIQKSENKLVKTIATMATNNYGRMYFPFLDDIVSGKKTIESIDSIREDSLQYFKALVKTQIDYTGRLILKDTPIAYLHLATMLQRKATEVFVNEINALHEEQDLVRFKIIEPLTANELYYLIVMTEDIIYTSSYNGTFKRMIEKMPTPAGDTLLMNVNFDRFKKFIKMAAGYNKLDNFLSTMPDSNAQRLMMAFVRGLDKTGALEEAVDVADSYGSIKTASVKKLIDREVASSLAKSKVQGNQKSETIYDILQNIFKSSIDTLSDISSKLGIPPVYSVNYADIAQNKDTVVQLVFFYGDKDGLESYASFMTLFGGSSEWKIYKNKEWIEIRSLKSKPILIYANLPLDNTDGSDPDAKAQANLLNYLALNQINPTIVIHRGHSYHLKYTIKQLPASAKIIVLGSCGGYHNLDEVLKASPNAHIISSKEVGTKTVNDPILKHLNDDLRAGRNINWINTWSDLSEKFTSGEAKERFENYIPPYKNLGALFIKAYNIKEAALISL